MKLCDLEVGAVCKILNITDKKLLKHRFMDFGIRRGSKLKIKNISLSKANMTVEIKNCTVAIRDEEASVIDVIKI